MLFRGLIALFFVCFVASGQQYGWYLYNTGVQPTLFYEIGIGSDALYAIGRSATFVDSIRVMKLNPSTFEVIWAKTMNNGTNRNWLMGGDVYNDTVFVTTWYGIGDQLMLWEMDSAGNLYRAQLWSRADVQPGAMDIYPDGSILMTAENLAPYAAVVRYFPSTGTFINNNWRVDGCSDMRLANSITAGIGSNPSIYAAATCVYQQFGVAKFDPNLNPIWITSLHFPGQSGGSNPNGTIIRYMTAYYDKIYVVGDVVTSVHGVGNGDRDLFIAAIDSATGNVDWAFAYGEAGYDVSYAILPSPRYSDRLIVAMNSRSYSSNVAGVLFEIDTSGAVISDSGYLVLDTFSIVNIYRLKPYNGDILIPAIVNQQPAIAFLPSELSQIPTCVQRVPVNRVPITFNVTNVWDVGSSLNMSSTTPYVRSDSFPTDTMCIVQCDIWLDSVFDVSCFGYNDGSAFASYLSGDSPVTIVWSSGGTGAMIDSLSSGTYWVALIGSQCTDTAYFTINQPPPLNATASSENPFFCSPPNGWVSVSVSGGTPPYSHSWSNGMSTDSIFNLPPGTYTDTIRDSNNCLTIISVTLDSPSTNLDYTYEVQCYSTNPYTLGITIIPNNGYPPYSIQWQDGTTSFSYNTPPDSLGFILSDSTNCLLYDTIVVSSPGNPSLQISPQIDTIYYGDTIILSIDETDISSFWWIFLNDSIYMPQLYLSPQTNTVVYAMGTDQYGCHYYDTAYIYLMPPKVFFPTVFTPNNDGTHDLFGPVIFGKVPVKWKIYNRWGQLIFEGDETSKWDGTINGKNASADKYVLIAYIYDSNTKQLLQKVIQDLYIVR